MDGKAPRLEMEETDNHEKEETDNHEKVEESSSSVIRRVRRSTGVGGKTPRLAINFKQVFLFFSIFNVSINFKQVRRRKVRAKVLQECFDVEDDEEEEDVTIVDGGAEKEEESGYCDACGQHFENKDDMEEHLKAEHGLLTCRWCSSKVKLVTIGNHLTNLCTSFTPLLGSHCSIHNQIETEAMASEAKYRGCRQFSCTQCHQRFDPVGLKKSLQQQEQHGFSCPGCLHGNVVALPKHVTKKVARQKLKKSRVEMLTEKDITLDVVTLVEDAGNPKEYARSPRSAKTLAKTKIQKYLQHSVNASTDENEIIEVETIPVESGHLEVDGRMTEKAAEKPTKTTAICAINLSQVISPAKSHENGPNQEPTSSAVHSVLYEIEATLKDIVGAPQEGGQADAETEYHSLDKRFDFEEGENTKEGRDGQNEDNADSMNTVSDQHSTQIIEFEVVDNLDSLAAAAQKECFGIESKSLEASEHIAQGQLLHFNTNNDDGDETNMNLLPREYDEVTNIYAMSDETEDIRELLVNNTDHEAVAVASTKGIEVVQLDGDDRCTSVISKESKINNDDQQELKKIIVIQEKDIKNMEVVQLAGESDHNSNKSQKDINIGITIRGSTADMEVVKLFVETDEVTIENVEEINSEAKESEKNKLDKKDWVKEGMTVPVQEVQLDDDTDITVNEVHDRDDNVGELDICHDDEVLADETTKESKEVRTEHGSEVELICIETQSNTLKSDKNENKMVETEDEAGEVFGVRGSANVEAGKRKQRQRETHQIYEVVELDEDETVIENISTEKAEKEENTNSCKNKEIKMVELDDEDDTNERHTSENNRNTSILEIQVVQLEDNDETNVEQNSHETKGEENFEREEIEIVEVDGDATNLENIGENGKHAKNQENQEIVQTDKDDRNEAEKESENGKDVVIDKAIDVVELDGEDEDETNVEKERKTEDTENHENLEIETVDLDGEEEDENNEKEKSGKDKEFALVQFDGEGEEETNVEKKNETENHENLEIEIVDLESENEKDIVTNDAVIDVAHEEDEDEMNVEKKSETKKDKENLEIEIVELEGEGEDEAKEIGKEKEVVQLDDNNESNVEKQSEMKDIDPSENQRIEMVQIDGEDEEVPDVEKKVEEGHSTKTCKSKEFELVQLDAEDEDETIGDRVKTNLHDKLDNLEVVLDDAETEISSQDETVEICRKEIVHEKVVGERKRKRKLVENTEDGLEKKRIRTSAAEKYDDVEEISIDDDEEDDVKEIEKKMIRIDTTEEEDMSRAVDVEEIRIDDSDEDDLKEIEDLQRSKKEISGKGRFKKAKVVTYPIVEDSTDVGMDVEKNVTAVSDPRRNRNLDLKDCLTSSQGKVSHEHKPLVDEITIVDEEEEDGDGDDDDDENEEEDDDDVEMVQVASNSSFSPFSPTVKPASSHKLNN